MKKKLVVHIGTPKTGTSFLQDVCVKNYDTLLNAGILYPGIKNYKFIEKANVAINASHILRLFFNEKNKEILCGLIHDNLTTVFSYNVDTVLISDETLIAYNPSNKKNLFIFECLIEVCKSLDIELSFVAYYRKPSKYLPSHWAQLVKKHKETLPLVDFVEKQKIPYWNNLLVLHKAFDNITIYSYDKEIATENGLIASFFKVLGIDSSTLELLPNIVVNESLSLNCLTALRLINAEFEDETIKSIENILTNAKPKNKLNKAVLTKELEKFVDDLYEEELYELDKITSVS